MMRKGLVAAIVAVLVLATPPTVPVAAQLVEDGRGVLTMAPLLDRVTPGVVNIAVKTRVAMQQNPLFQDPFFRRFFAVPGQPRHRESISAGSGVIVDAEKGYVLTNHHVIDNATSIVVTLKDRREFRAELIGSDPATDIALLRIEPDGLSAVPFGDSDNLFVGDFVVAIGNPFGIGQTVTSGIISALGRSGLGIEGYEDFIQTDASINPGNSGGALVDSTGKLIGINTAIIGPGGGNVGIGFAVPSNMARAVMEQLARYGEVRRGRLGVAIQDLTVDVASALGVDHADGAVLTSIDEGSPAAKAGLKAGDVVVAIDGRIVRNSSDLRNQIGLVPPGREVALTIIRDGSERTVVVEVEPIGKTSLSGDETIPELAGAEFRDLPGDHPLHGRIDGVLVAEVAFGSPAWRFGFRPGDVVLSVNRIRVASVENFLDQIARAGKVIPMNVLRNGREFFVVLER
ncbi:MAG: DegQ family serine endoprotease [Rhodospirillales bacterium]